MSAIKLLGASVKKALAKAGASVNMEGVVKAGTAGATAAALFGTINGSPSVDPVRPLGRLTYGLPAYV